MVTGDFVFVGDVGRPDLLEKAAKVAGTMEAGARQLYRSLGRLASLPDHLQIWPGHGAGSACGKALGAMPTSTLGYERRTNWAFAVKSEEAFVAAVLEGQPSPPTYFATMKRINRDGAAILGNRGMPRRLSPTAFDAAREEGPVLDVRPKAQYAQGHLHGTLNIPLIRAFTTWAGWLLPYDRPITLVAGSEDDATEAQTALASIGLDRVQGWFGPDLLSERAGGDAWRTATHGDVTEAESMVASGRMVVDLREPNEWRAGHIPGAVHHPLGTITETLAGVPRDTPIAVHCQAGTRSAIGASVLESMGFDDVVDLHQGFSGWATARRATVRA
jgi:hydroxyacylglutathione hydrolase